MGIPQSVSIDRRTFLAEGLSIPFLSGPGFHQCLSSEFNPISMARCVVTPQCGGTPEHIWRCQINRAAASNLMPGWWLFISQSDEYPSHLTVIQPIFALPQHPGLSGMLAARITFRLQVLKRRGILHGKFNLLRVVQHVNRQILKAMENLPIE